MAQRVRTAAVLACVLFAASASADGYPTAFINRPLTLDPSTPQLFGAAELARDFPASTNAEALELGLDYGVAHDLQVGAIVDVAVSPSTQFGRGLATGQYQLLEFAALRVDLGAQRVDNGDLYAAFGVGLPVKLKLTDKVAFVSGRPYAWGAEDDILFVRTDASSSVTDVHIPGGLLFQLDPHVAIAARSGFRAEGSAYYVPLGADAILTAGPLDIGVTVDLAGQIAPSNGSGYTDLLTVRGFVQLRL
ncbi:MAG TPA: hypothetical protein VMJ10_33130 [Kofleriaceae bacterium]|nr:hypothetical protein [Kofleriaceae bacterium]